MTSWPRKLRNPIMLLACETRPFRLRRSRHLCRPSSIDTRIPRDCRLGPVWRVCQCPFTNLPHAAQLCRLLTKPCKQQTRLTSINTKLGTTSSPGPHHPVPNAPVALPGFTKNFPSISYASNLCVPPHNNTSTSICLAAINNASGSPGGTIVCPCVKPMRSEPCETTF